MYKRQLLGRRLAFRFHPGHRRAELLQHQLERAPVLVARGRQPGVDDGPSFGTHGRDAGLERLLALGARRGDAFFERLSAFLARRFDGRVALGFEPRAFAADLVTMVDPRDADERRGGDVRRRQRGRSAVVARTFQWEHDPPLFLVEGGIHRHQNMMRAMRNMSTVNKVQAEQQIKTLAKIEHADSKVEEPNDNRSSASINAKVSAWNLDDVGDWLGTLALGQYRSAFLDAAIDGAFLFDLNDEDLRNTLGIEHNLHRKKILSAIQRLKEVDRGYAMKFLSDKQSTEMPPNLKEDSGMIDLSEQKKSANIQHIHEYNAPVSSSIVDEDKLLRATRHGKLKEREQKANEFLRESKAKLSSVDKQRQQMGAALYMAQQQLAKSQNELGKTHEASNSAQQQRIVTEQVRESGCISHFSHIV